MWWYLLGSWIFLVLLIWFVVYGASLYDRRSSTARHRVDQVLDELDFVLDSYGDPVIVGE